MIAGRIVPEGSRLGNFRQSQHFQAARLLFYGGCSIQEPKTEPAEVFEELNANPDTVFLSSTADYSELSRPGESAPGLVVLYRTGDLVLFGLDKKPRQTGGSP